ncbi:MAG: ATP-grasp domain-containing protein [Planctomycetota bacterium]|jgi:ribosomal protein S6--L-glutamate ligase
MRILLLSANAEYYSTRKIRAAFLDRGHEVLHAEPMRCELGPGEDGRALFSAGRLLDPFDVCIPRLSKPHLEHTFHLLEALESQKVLLLNPLPGLQSARNKFKTFEALRRANIPTPDTTLVSDPDRLEAAADRVGGFPVIMKPLHATQGSGVSIVRDASSGRTLLEHFLARGEGAVFQTRIPEAMNGDIRLIIVGPRILGAMRRNVAIGDFRANLHQGGIPEALPPSDALRDLAFRAVGALGLRFAGVDVVQTAKGYQVLEINASPGIEGFEGVTGIDAAVEVVQLTERLLAHPA